MKKVLIVETDGKVVERLNSFFSKFGFQVDIAEDGKKAIEMAKENPYDLLLTEVVIPKTDGFNLSRSIKNISDKTTVFIISGIYKGASFRQKAIHNFKADEFIEKPFSIEDLKEKIEKYMGPLDAISEEKKDSSSDEGLIGAEELFGDILQEVSMAIENEKKKQPKPSGDATQKFPSLKELEKTIELSEEVPSGEKRKRNIDTTDIDELLEKTLVDLKIKVPKKQKAKTLEKKPASAIKTEEKQKTTVSPPKIEEEKYELLEKIAVGGMAEIYKAKQKGPVGFEKIITIKRILPFLSSDEEFITMFTDEARIAAQLSHPNIVQIFDLGKYKGDYIIAMEYVPGKDLGAILKKLRKEGKKLPYDLIAYIAVGVAEALIYAHKKKDSKGNPLNIVHRDISPQNILISFEGEVKLTDFGISKAQNKIHQTVAGGLKGKFIYMSPEQAKGEVDIDYRADIFSFGTLLYEMIALKNPFIDKSEVAILERVKNVKYVPLKEIVPDVPEELNAIVEGCLKENPKDRFSDMKAVREIIEKFLAKEGINLILLKDKLAKFVSRLFPEEFKKEGFAIEDTREISRREAEIKKIPVKFKEEKINDKIEVDKKVAEEKPPQKEDAKIKAESKSEEEEVKVAKSKEELLELFKQELGVDEKELKKAPEVQKEEVKREVDEHELKAEIEEAIRSERKGFPLILIVVVFLVLGIAGGGGYLFYKNKKAFESDYVNPAQGIKTIVPVKTASEAFGKPLEKVIKEEVKGEEQKQGEADQTPSQPQQLQPQIQNQPTNQNNLQANAQAQQQITQTQKPQQVAQQTQSKQQITNNKIQTQQSSPQNQAQPQKQKVQPQEQPQKQPPQTQFTQPAQQQKEQQTQVNEKPQTVQQEQQAKETQPQPQGTQQKITAEKQQAAEKPKLKRGDLVPLTEVDSKPKIIKKSTIRLPMRARMARVKVFRFSAMLLIDENGNVTKIRLLVKKDPYGITDSAIKSIYKWKFSPAQKNGIKVKVWMPYTIIIR